MIFAYQYLSGHSRSGHYTSEKEKETNTNITHLSHKIIIELIRKHL